MEEKSMKELMDSAFDKKLDHPNKVKSRMKSIALENVKRLPPLPPQLHAPDAEELLQIREYMIAYKKLNQTASKREIRKAAQQHFGVVIYREPFKREKNAV